MSQVVAALARISPTGDGYEGAVFLRGKLYRVPFALRRMRTSHACAECGLAIEAGEEAWMPETNRAVRTYRWHQKCVEPWFGPHED